MCEEKTELMSHDDVRDLYFKYVSDFRFKDESGFVWYGFMPELDFALAIRSNPRSSSSPSNLPYYHP